jgi:nitrogen fixation NifU-like protein
MAIDRSMPRLSSLFQELILDHYRRPRNRGRLADPDADVHMNNPACGDDVHLHLRLKDGVIEDAKFTGEGCSISQASISMMTQLIRGRSTEDALRLAARFTAMMHGDADAAQDRELGEARALAGVAKFPVRIKCALLGWNALEEAVAHRHRPDRPAS